MNFVAIDFETANFNVNSACAVGLVKCINGEFVDEREWFIRPPTSFFEKKCIKIHGMTYEDVYDKPSFQVIWCREMADFIGDFPLVAHNAVFDRGVLYGTLKYYGLAVPSFWWGCTLEMTRKILRKGCDYRQPDCKLNSVAAHFGIIFRHHNALEDSLAVAKITREIQKMISPEEFRHFFRQFNGLRKI
ncbi:MAG: 3'-5' exonuclease [Planctomycetia bacterium]|nr:3'-5' exonuclease [Planctomycetia bacterium]